MNDLRTILGCATDRRRVDELRSILAEQRSRLAGMRVHKVQKSSWTARDGEGWINHSTVDGTSQNDVALTIREGDLVVVLNATDVAVSYDPHVLGAEATAMPPHPSPTEADAAARMDATIALFDAMLASRSSGSAIRTGRRDADALLLETETRMRAIGCLAVSEGADPSAGVQIQAPTAWRGLEAVGLVRGEWTRMLGAERRASLWSGLPPLLRVEIEPAETQAARALSRRSSGSWRVDLHPSTIQWHDRIDSVVERMRILSRLPHA